MKRIAITTYWDTHTNYGQILQGYALQQVLKKNGYYPFIIKYSLKEENSLYSHLLNRIKNGISIKKLINGKYFKRLNKVITIPLNDSNKSRDFDTFRKRMMFTEKCYDSYSELKAAPPIADVYLTGSDQVWGAWIRTQTKRIFLLDFGSAQTKRIAYAASFSRDQLFKSEKELYHRCLTQFSFVGIREKSGLNICSDLKLENATLVADPTILLTKDQWSSLTEKRTIRNFNFAYSVDTCEDNPILKKTIVFLENQNSSLIYTSSALFEDPLSNCRPTVEEWITYISRAKTVATSSFHGVIFCLIFNTPFLAVLKPNKNRHNTRLISILNMVGLSDRLIDEGTSQEDLEKISKTAIDWDEINKKLALFRDNSIKMLIAALEKEN